MNTLTQLPDEYARELAAIIATMQQLSKPAKERWLAIGQGIAIGYSLNKIDMQQPSEPTKERWLDIAQGAAIGCSLNKKEQKKEETK